MPTMTCDHAGCQKTFTHETQKATVRALIVHKWRKHNAELTSAAPLDVTKAPVAKKQPRAGTDADHRTRAWRSAHADEAKRVGNRNPRTLLFTGKVKSEDHIKHKAHEKTPVTQTVNFCPCCGCNIQKVAMGMILTQKM